MITLDTVRQVVKAAVEPLRARARGMVRRAVLLALDNSEGLARVQVELTKDEIADGVELLSWPGISIRPEGCEAVVLSIGGNPSNLIAIPSQRGKRLSGEDLSPGEVALHIGNANQVVRLKKDGSILLQSGTEGAKIILKANGDVVFDTPPGAKIFQGQDGALHALALADVCDDNFALVRTQFNNHKHQPPTFALSNGGGAVTGTINPSGTDGPMTGIVSTASDTIYGVS